MTDTTDIKNKRAFFEYAILDRYTAGIQLRGSEIKSVREGKVNLGDSFCYFVNGELWVKNLHISEYRMAGHYGHDPLRQRKLLLNRSELRKMEVKVKEKGLTLIPLRMFISGRGHAKLEIALAKGKKLHDKRQSIREKEAKREIQKGLKIR